MKITIITVTYNAASVLQRTLNSVKEQTWQQIEHLIIDGASKDDTIAIAKTYQAQCSYEVVIQSEPDKGLYDAMNKGLVKSQKPTAESQLPAIMYGDTAVTDENGKFLHLRRLRPPQQLNWKSFRQGMLVCHQAFYVRTDIAKGQEYDLQYRHSADVDWCIRVMKQAEQMELPIVNTYAVLADFMEGGNTTQNHWASLKERYQVMCHHYGGIQTFFLHVWFVIRSIIK